MVQDQPRGKKIHFIEGPTSKMKWLTWKWRWEMTALGELSNDSINGLRSSATILWVECGDQLWPWDWEESNQDPSVGSRWNSKEGRSLAGNWAVRDMTSDHAHWRRVLVSKRPRRLLESFLVKRERSSLMLQKPTYLDHSDTQACQPSSWDDEL